MVNDDLDLSQRFWTNLSTLLKKRGKSSRWLAITLGVSPNTISKYSRGSVPNLTLAAKIARLFNISLDTLVFGSPGDVRAADEAQSEDLSILQRVEQERLAGRRLADELNLGRLVVLASSTAVRREEIILRSLVERFPDYVEEDEFIKKLLRTHSSLNLKELRPAITALCARGVVDEHPDNPAMIRATAGNLHVRRREINDEAALALEAIRAIAQDVLPVLQHAHKNAKLSLFRLRVVPEKFQELARRSNQAIEKLECQFDAGGAGREVLTLHAMVMQPADRGQN